MEVIGNIGQWLMQQLKAIKPSFISKKPHFDFITVHYFYIIGMTILCSVMIFGTGHGNIAYVDALFFSAGANTQAGLNTIDVCAMNTFQQAVLLIMALISSPISINSLVVWLRLYWFNKRFQHVVREARQRRGTISKSKTQAKNEAEAIERGVNGRNITVMHGDQPSGITNDGLVLDNSGAKRQHEGFFMTGARSVPHCGDTVREPPVTDYHDTRNTEIRFADTVRRNGNLGFTAKYPQNRSEEDHIAILERQRRADDEVLRIPGPRDAERGERPTRVEESDTDEPDPLSQKGSRSSTSSEPPQRSGPAETRPQTIIIEEPDKQQQQARQRPAEAHREHLHDDVKAFKNVFSFLWIRRPRLLNKKDKQLHRPENEFHITQSKGKRRNTMDTLRTAFSRDKEDGTPYLSWEPTLGRNSAFPDLTEEQRDELGGIEYRSLKTLANILFWFFLVHLLFGIICFLPWILMVNTYGQIVDAVQQNRVWWGLFTPASAFADLGFTLTPDSMNSFNTATYPLLIMSFLIVVGNTGFPVMLRFLIWLFSTIIPRSSGLYEELCFLLDHPRRCFTLLFPSQATWWLFWLLVILNGVDLIFFVILDLGAGPINDLPGGVKVLDGFFQAISTRTAGFSCINLATLHPAVQVSYMIMMYISVLPIAISVRRTNVYEEKSLGIYSSQAEDDEHNNTDVSYVGTHLRRQLSFDLWYIFVGFFILSISEGSKLVTGDLTMFGVLFEIVSAYGTVGMSLGYTGTKSVAWPNASLSGQFSVVGKLVIIAMMVRGRHRGLPYGLDRAIMLPSESLHAAETQDASAQLMRRNSQHSVATTAGFSTSIRRGKQLTLERRNSNIFTGLLHPGPPVPRTPTTSGPTRPVPELESDAGPYNIRGTHRRSSTMPTENKAGRPLSSSA